MNQKFKHSFSERVEYFKNIDSNIPSEGNMLGQIIDLSFSDLIKYQVKKTYQYFNRHAYLRTDEDRLREFQVIRNKLLLGAKSYYFFWETKSPFSQWHKVSFKAPFYMERSYISSWMLRKSEKVLFEFTSAEQAMMHYKAILFGDIDSSEKILNEHNPRKIKELGRAIKGFNQELWDHSKVGIVYQANAYKFDSDPTIKEQLISTRGKVLVEASPFDKIWGIGMGKDHPDSTNEEKWQGYNFLGEILTSLRIKEFETV